MSEADQFLEAIEALMVRYPDTLNALGAGIVLGAHQGLAKDTRSFARKLDVAHALVIRECVALALEHDLLRLDDRQERSQRVFYELTERAHAMVKDVCGTPDEDRQANEAMIDG